ncbi:MAG TPA: D-hexose-6-phosphate mutarotase, partial [Anaerolineaceae bacterium]
LSTASEFGPNASIRGGIPVIFPQFSILGPSQRHGFARRTAWTLASTAVDEKIARARFLLRADDATRAAWPFEFEAELAVTVGGSQLEEALTIRNSGAQEFSFTAALHTYLRVDDIHDVVVEGVGGLTYIESLTTLEKHTQPPGAVTFTGPVDKIFLNAPGELTVREKGRALRVEKQGFPDAVVWNPWIEGGASLPDLEPGGYLHMLCIEPAAISQPITLVPGAAWTGMQRLVEG